MTDAERLLARAQRRVVKNLTEEIQPLVSLAIDKLEEAMLVPGVDATTMAAVRECLDRFAGKSVARVDADVRGAAPTVLLSSERLDALLAQAAERRKAQA